MAPHSSAFAWKIPWTEETGGLQSMGSLQLDTTERLHFQFHALEEEMATHSSVLAWRIPGTAEPDGLPSMGSHRVGHDWSDLAAAAADIHSLIMSSNVKKINTIKTAWIKCWKQITEDLSWRWDLFWYAVILSCQIEFLCTCKPFRWLTLEHLALAHHFSSEKAKALHSSTLDWKIPWTEEPGRLQSMGLQRVGHAWATSLSFFTFMRWRGKLQLTPVFLPGESQGWGSLVGCHLWGCAESDTTEST